MRQVLIVHGWSDTSKSFRPLAEFLQGHGYQATPIWLGDYISLEDDVRVEDVAKRMQAVLHTKLATEEVKAPFDMIVHSTGGLVAREWLSAFYSRDIAGCPLKRLIMLAPANFGSRLATLGQSMLGRVVKGWRTWFHTGKEMLNSLELSSPYQWDLAQRDLFVPEGLSSAPAVYGEEAVWPFVIIGTHPYTSALRQIVNENGADGTVRVPAANLNTRGVTIDFAADEAHPRVAPWTLRHGDTMFPFAVLPDRTHGSIITPDESDVPVAPGYNDGLGDLLLDALECADYQTYQTLGDTWHAISEQTAGLVDDAERKAIFGADEGQEPFHQYLQVNVRVVDDHGADVGDYFLEFSGPDEERGDQSFIYFHSKVLEDVHVNQTNSSYRCLYVDRTDLFTKYYATIRGRAAKVLNMSISANPPGDDVSYFANYKEGAKGAMTVHQQDEQSPESRWLKRNTTHFVKIVIPRTPADKVFQLTQA
jgi:pimeloyl-ACP methyl ester carboxylesterase